MQLNTTGICMEVFFIILVNLTLIFKFFTYREFTKMTAMQKQTDTKVNELLKSMEIILTDSEIFHKKLDDLLPSQPNSSTKPNNWDSMRKVFSRPVREDERD